MAKFTAFKNADVAAKYDRNGDSDPIVHLPGRKASGFKCRVSDLTLEQADRLVANKSNLLILKGAAKEAKVASPEKSNKKSEEK